MRHVSLHCFLFLVSAAGGVAGCADPNPTFVFDAAPTAREGGAAGADGGGTDGGAVDADDGGGTDGAGGPDGQDDAR